MKLTEYLKLRDKLDDSVHVYQGGGNILAMQAANAIDELCVELRACRNELCLRCGNYKEAYKGACDGCRWKDMGD